MRHYFMNKKVINYTLDEVKKVSNEIAAMLIKRNILLLYGDLGAGKTTLLNILAGRIKKNKNKFKNFLLEKF